MQARSPRTIQDGKAYRHLIPKAKLTETTVKRGATVQDTVRLIPQVVAQTKWQTKALTKQLKEIHSMQRAETFGNLFTTTYDTIKTMKELNRYEAPQGRGTTGKEEWIAIVTRFS